MRAITKRVDALEHRAGMNDGSGWDHSKPGHVIIKDEGQPYREALAEYIAANPDRPVEGDHNVMWIELVTPKADADGRAVTQDKGPEGLGVGPELAEVLAELRA